MDMEHEDVSTYNSDAYIVHQIYRSEQEIKMEFRSPVFLSLENHSPLNFLVESLLTNVQLPLDYCYYSLMLEMMPEWLMNVSMDNQVVRMQHQIDMVDECINIQHHRHNSENV